jgi:hypothetical protein
MLVALALALLAAAALRPSIRGNDGVGHYVYLASLLRDGDLDFTNDYARFDAIKQYPYKFAELKRSAVTGRPSNRYGIGAACFWAPFVAGTHLALKVVAPGRADAMGRPYEWAVGLGTAFWGSLGLALLYGRLRRELAPLGAGAIIAGLVLASPLGFYLYAHGSMSHGVGFFFAVMQMLAFERAWRRPALWGFAWFGFWSAWLVMARFQDASWVLMLGGALVVRLWGWAREDVKANTVALIPNHAKKIRPLQERKDLGTVNPGFREYTMDLARFSLRTHSYLNTHRGRLPKYK